MTFLGRSTEGQLKYLFATCQALIFPPREDLGITPIEAIASDVPVIAYKPDGTLDYVRPRVNGDFFADQTGKALARKLGANVSAFDPETIA
ncbi:MAG: glycosyltransferase [Pseudomonadota bacterium]